MTLYKHLSDLKILPLFAEIWIIDPLSNLLRKLKYLLFYPQGFNHAEKEYLFILGHCLNCISAIPLFLYLVKLLLTDGSGSKTRAHKTISSIFILYASLEANKVNDERLLSSSRYN